jgi:hypothetical protein
VELPFDAARPALFAPLDGVRPGRPPQGPPRRGRTRSARAARRGQACRGAEGASGGDCFRSSYPGNRKGSGCG